MRGLLALGRYSAKPFRRVNRVPLSRAFSTTHIPELETLLKRLEDLRKTSGSDADDTINMMSQVANTFRDAGKLEGAADLYEEAEREVVKKYGEFHPHTYSCKANLGTIYGLMGRARESCQLLKEAVDGFKPLGDMYRVPRLQALSYLSILLHRSGLNEEAAISFKDVIEERTLAITNGDISPGEGMDVLGVYGVLLRDMDQIDSSIETLEAALRTLKFVVGKDITDPTTAYVAFQLAVSYQCAGKLPEAEAIYKEIFDNKVIDADNIGFKEVLSRYESILMELGKFDELVKIFSELAKTLEENRGKSDKLSLYCMTTLAKAYHGLKNISASTALLKEVISIMTENNDTGIYSFEIALLNTNMATIMHEQKMYYEAGIYYKMALSGYDSIVKHNLKDLPDQSIKVLWDNTILAHRNYATFLEETDRFSEASSLYAQLLETLVANGANEEEVKVTVSCYNALALKLHEEKRSYPEAEQAFRFCLHHQTLLQGDKAADTLILRINLADNLRCQDKIHEAENHLHVVVPLLRELFGNSHQSTIFGMTVLAGVYRSLGKYVNAEPLLQEILEYHIEKNGHNHPEVFMAKSNLGICTATISDSDTGPALIREAVKGLEASVGLSHDATISARCSLAACVLSRSSKDDAIEILEETLDRVKNVYGENHDVYKYVDKQLNHAIAA